MGRAEQEGQKEEAKQCASAGKGRTAIKEAPNPTVAQPNLAQNKTLAIIVAYVFNGEFLTSNLFFLYINLRKIYIYISLGFRIIVKSK